MLDEIRRFIDNPQHLPPPLQSLIQSQGRDSLLKFFEKTDEEFGILVSGKTGNGKSTLVNGLIGCKMAKESKYVSREGMTKAVTPHHLRTDEGNIRITVYDSPGLQDSDAGENDTAHMADMKAIKSNLHLSIFCLRMIDVRLSPGSPDVITMKRLTETFGHDYWKHAVIVLTFANAIESIDIEMQETDDPDTKNRMFNNHYDSWKAAIRKALIDDVHISPRVAENVDIIPAGHYKKPKLYDEVKWLSKLWVHCFVKIRSSDAAAAFLCANLSRITSPDDVTAEDFSREPEEQPLVFGERETLGVPRNTFAPMMLCLLAAIYNRARGPEAFKESIVRYAFIYMFPDKYKGSMTHFEPISDSDQ